MKNILVVAALSMLLIFGAGCTAPEAEAAAPAPAEVPETPTEVPSTSPSLPEEGLPLGPGPVIINETEEYETEKHYCTQAEKSVEKCSGGNAPVCGDNGITYTNACTACVSGNIDYWTWGGCEEQKGETRCDMLPDAGPCRSLIPKYYYEEESGSCQQFMWGGCQGSVPFDTMAECEAACEANVSGEHICSDAEKEAVICTMEYRAVCGNNGQTYGNPCTACASGEIDSWTEGECAN